MSQSSYPSVRLDPVCLTCANQPGEKRILYDLFKIACLKYRPSDVRFPRPRGLAHGPLEEITFKRKDALAHRQKFVDTLLAVVFSNSDQEEESILKQGGEELNHNFNTNSLMSGRASPAFNQLGNFLE